MTQDIERLVIPIIRRYLQRDSQRPCSWHEVEDCIVAIRERFANERRPDMDSDTPETDAWEQADGYVAADFARSIERRLREAEEKISKQENDIAYLTDEVAMQKRLVEAAERASAGMVTGGWRYRDKRTGIVTLTDQPPDRVSDLDQYEVTELFACDPRSAARKEKP